MLKVFVSLIAFSIINQITLSTLIHHEAKFIYEHGICKF